MARKGFGAGEGGRPHDLSSAPLHTLGAADGSGASLDDTLCDMGDVMRCHCGRLVSREAHGVCTYLFSHS